MIPFLILISIVTTITTTCLAYDPEMYLQENDNFGGTKEDYYMNDFKGQYRFSFENPNTIKQFQDGFADGGKVGFYAFVGPDKRFYITCYTAINGYRAKSIIVVTDMPYDDLQDFCQKKFNAVTNSFEDLGDVKNFIETKKKSEITTATTTTTNLKNVKHKISVPISKVKGQPVDKIIFENSSEGGVTTSGKIITDDGINSKTDISSTGTYRGKSNFKGSRVIDDHPVTINENGRTNVKLTEKTSSRSSSRGRTRGNGKINGNKNISVEEIKRGGKASILTGDIPTHLNIEIDVPQENGIDKKINSKISGKSSEEISSGNLQQKTKQIITPDSNIELVGGKIPLTDTKKHVPETEILIPIAVKSSTNSDKPDKIFSTISSIEKNSGSQTTGTTSSNIPAHGIELLDIPIPDEVYFPESLNPHATFDPTNGKGSGGSTTTSTQSGIRKKEKIRVSTSATEKSKPAAPQIPLVPTGINKITVDTDTTNRGKPSIEISNSDKPSIEIDTEKIVPSKTRGKTEKSVIEQNIITSGLAKDKSISQTIVGINVNKEKSGSSKGPGTNQKLIIEESVLEKTKGHSANTIIEPITSIGSDISRDTKTNAVVTSNKHEKNDITIQPSISKTNTPPSENSVLPTPALDSTRIIGMRGSAEFSANGRGGSAASGSSGASNGGRSNGGSGSGGSESGGSRSGGSGSAGSGSAGNGSAGSGSAGSGSAGSGSAGSGSAGSGSAGSLSGGSGSAGTGSAVSGSAGSGSAGSGSAGGGSAGGGSAGGGRAGSGSAGSGSAGSGSRGSGSSSDGSSGKEEGGISNSGIGSGIAGSGTADSSNKNSGAGLISTSNAGEINGSGSCGRNGCGGNKGGSSSSGFTTGNSIPTGNISSKGGSITGGRGLSISGGSSGGGSIAYIESSGGSAASGDSKNTRGNGSASGNIRGNGFGGSITSGSGISAGNGGGGRGSNTSGKIDGGGLSNSIAVGNEFSSSIDRNAGGGGGGGSGSASGSVINPNQCVGQLVTKVVTQPAQTVTVTIQPTQTQKSTVSVPTALSGNSCRAKIVVEDSNKKLLVLHPTDAEMESITERAAKSLNCGHLTFLSK